MAALVARQPSQPGVSHAAARYARGEPFGGPADGLRDGAHDAARGAAAGSATARHHWLSRRAHDVLDLLGGDRDAIHAPRIPVGVAYDCKPRGGADRDG